jgi:hypothetical protein
MSEEPLLSEPPLIMINFSIFTRFFSASIKLDGIKFAPQIFKMDETMIPNRTLLVALKSIILKPVSEPGYFVAS